jgi:hypothetical protein
VARRVGAILVVGALAAAACAQPNPPTLSSESLVAGIPESVWPADPGLITEVECPAVDEGTVAQSTICTARLHGESLTIDVTVAEDGATTATVRETLFDVAAAEAEAARRLSADLGGSAEVTCAVGVIVADVGGGVDCRASHDHATIDFTLEILDTDGSWTLVIAADGS